MSRVLIIENNSFYSKISKVELTKKGMAVKVTDGGDGASNVLAETETKP